MKDEWKDISPETIESLGEDFITPEQIIEEMDKTAKGIVRKTQNNFVIVLELDPKLKGSISKNMLTGRIDIVKSMWWQRETETITDDDLAYIRLYIEQTYGINSDKELQNAIRVVADRNRYHPIREYLNTLKWDGQERVRYALKHFLGADDSDLTYEELKIFMLGAIERVFNPGCKFETMLCLVGSQGAGKSSFFRYLALKDEWFSDDLRKLDDENVYRKMQGHWIIELAEMLATTGAKTIEETKAFISRQKETYKVPYDRYPTDRPRQCVFAGTSNKKRFLPFDRTGNRRFFPVITNIKEAECHVLSNERHTREYMDQLWAEVYEIYKSGKYSLTLPDDMKEEMEEFRLQFMAEDTVAGLIINYLEETKEKYVCTLMLYDKALGNDGKPNRKEVTEINDIMANVITGWEEGPNHRFNDYGTQRSWVRSAVNEKTDEDDFIKLTDEDIEQVKLIFGE